MSKTKKSKQASLAPDLHCHSTFSLMDGIGKPENVVQRAQELSWPAVSLTEHGWMGSAPILYKAAKEVGIKPIIGCEFYVTPDEWLGVQDKSAQKKSFHLTTLALSAEGYHNLVAWTTFANRRDKEFQNFYHKPRISIGAMVDIAPYPLHHNVVFSGCLSGELLRFMLAPGRNGDLWPGALSYVEMMKSVFSNFYLEFQNHEIPKFMGQGFEQYESLIDTEHIVHTLLTKLHKISGVPCVITNDSHMQWSNQRKPHLAMKVATWKHNEGAMDRMNPTQVSEQLRSYSYYGNYMRSMEAVADGLPTKIRDEALANVLAIAREADINLSPLDKFNYSLPVSGYSNPLERMRKRSSKRLAKLIQKHGQVAAERFEHEIRSMGDFAHYLLLMSDFIKNAKRQGIRTHTRGSAANSILCYCLDIHDIDSIHYGLTFERFYNPSRKKLPDIDVDINPDRYDDFMRFVIERMEELEGEGQVVQICNYGTLANRAAFRMIAEAQGVPKETVDEISKILPSMIDSGMVEEEDSAFEIIKEEYPEIYELTSGVFDSIKNISQHACAWLFGTKDRPIEQWVPLCLIASSNTLVTQYNYKLIDKYFGMVKGDFLRLNTLAVMDTALDMAGIPFDFEIPLDDDDTYEMICSGDTEGVHSMQGKTQRQGCLEVQPKNVFDLTAIQALYRPSGTRTGFDKIFVKRRRGKEKITKIHPVVDKALSETYGLPIYQEQTLDIGYALGMDHAEIQKLLDAIKLAKGQGRGATEAFEALWPMFWKHAKANGLKKEKAREIWSLIDAFQGYGFNKGHATSYAILAAQTAYLKKNLPREYATALLEKYPNKVRYVADARRHGFSFENPDVNHSHAGFSTGSSDELIRIGLSRIRYLGPVAVKAIISNQPYSSFDDFRSKVSNRAVNATRVEALAALGALESLGVKRLDELIVKRKEKGKIVKRVLDSKDLIEFYLLGFTVGMPEVMRGLKPLYTTKQTVKGSEWSHKGYESGVELTEGPVSVSKMFWIPNLPKLDIYRRKTSSWAKIQTNLLTAVDENGIEFHIKANEDKPDKVALLDFFASKLRGGVVCLDGAIRSPFTYNDPLSFQLFNVTGVYKGDPQIFTDSNNMDDFKLVIDHITKEGRKKKVKSYD